MYNTTIANVSGLTATDTAGKRLYITGNMHVAPGQQVWTDGNIIYGNTYGGGDSPVIVSSKGFIWLDYYSHTLYYTDNINKPFKELGNTDSLLITTDDKGNLYDFGEYVQPDEPISLMVESDACFGANVNVCSIRVTGGEWQRNVIGVYENGEQTGSIDMAEYFKTDLENKAKALSSGGEIRDSLTTQCYINRLTIHPDASWLCLSHEGAGSESYTLQVSSYNFDGYTGFYRRHYASEVYEVHKTSGKDNNIAECETLGIKTRASTIDMPVGYRAIEQINDNDKYLVLWGKVFNENQDLNIVEALLEDTGLEDHAEEYFSEMLKMYNGDEEYKKKDVIEHEYQTGEYKHVKIVRYCPVSLPVKQIKNTENESTNVTYTWELDNTTCYIEGVINPATGYMINGSQIVEGYDFRPTDMVKDMYQLKNGAWLALVKPSDLYYELRLCQNGEIKTIIGSGTDFRCAHVSRIRPVKKTMARKVINNNG